MLSCWLFVWNELSPLLLQIRYGYEIKLSKNSYITSFNGEISKKVKITSKEVVIDYAGFIF